MLSLLPGSLATISPTNRLRLAESLRDAELAVRISLGPEPDLTKTESENKLSSVPLRLNEKKKLKSTKLSRELSTK